MLPTQEASGLAHRPIQVCEVVTAMKLRAIAFMLLIVGAGLIALASLPALAVSGFLDQPNDSAHAWDQ